MRISLQEFADKISDIMPVIAKEFSKRNTNELCRGKITLPQLLILGFLYRNGDSKMSTIANYMTVSTAAMTCMVDRLTRYGYVKREHEPGDRRIINTRLTEKGARLVEKINIQRRQMIIDIFGKVSETDRLDYLRVLIKIREALTRNGHGQT